MGLPWWPFSGLSWAFPWPLRWGGGPAPLALSVASRGPFRAFLAVGWLLVGSCGGWAAGGGFLVAFGGLLWPFLWALWGPAGLARLGLSGPFLGLFRAFLASFLGLVAGVLVGSPTLVLPGFLLVSCPKSWAGPAGIRVESGRKAVGDSLFLPLVWSLSRGCEACRRWPGEGKYFLYSYFTSVISSITIFSPHILPLHQSR